MKNKENLPPNYRALPTNFRAKPTNLVKPSLPTLPGVKTSLNEECVNTIQIC